MGGRSGRPLRTSTTEVEAIEAACVSLSEVDALLADRLRGWGLRHGEAAQDCADLLRRYRIGEHDPVGLNLVRELGRAKDRLLDALEAIERDGLVRHSSRGNSVPHPAIAVERAARRSIIDVTRALALESAAGRR